MRAKFIALTVSLGLSAPAGVHAAIEHFCRMAGVVRGACCCDGAREAERTTPCDAITRPDCCSYQSSAAEPPAPSARPGARDALAIAVLPVPVRMPEAGGARGSAAAPIPSDGRSTGPPLFSLHCAYLT